MATRLYFDPTNEPDVSPTYGDIASIVWGDTSQAVRRKLNIGTKGDVGGTGLTVTEISGSNISVLVAQFVSEPVNSYTEDLPALQYVFRCSETAAKADAAIRTHIGRCDGDGSNATWMATLTASGEFDDGSLVSRYAGPYDRAETYGVTQGQRIIVEVGVAFTNSKPTEYGATIDIRDNAANDLDLSDSDTGVDNCWYETGSTFTEALAGSASASPADNVGITDAAVGTQFVTALIEVADNEGVTDDADRTMSIVRTPRG